MQDALNPESNQGDKYDEVIGGVQRSIEMFLANKGAEHPQLVEAWKYFEQQLDFIDFDGGTIPGVCETPQDRADIINAYYDQEEDASDLQKAKLDTLYNFVLSQGGFEDLKQEDLKNLHADILKIISNK